MLVSLHKRPVEEHNILDYFLFKYTVSGPISFTYKLGLTPNFLTTLSFASQIYSLYHLSQFNIFNYQFYYLLGYYFDCIDGPMARKYDMVTKLGDWYDHGTDTVCFLGALYYYITYYNLFRHYYLVFTMTTLFVGLLKYIGCQETIYNHKLSIKDKSMTLYPCTYLVKNAEKEMKYFNYFSYTTFLLYFSSIPTILYLTS